MISEDQPLMTSTVIEIVAHIVIAWIVVQVAVRSIRWSRVAKTLAQLENHEKPVSWIWDKATLEIVRISVWEAIIFAIAHVLLVGADLIEVAR